MHIFCRETEAHLELHPHLLAEDKSSGGLITPDLWLKNCKSPDSRTSSPPPESPKPPQLHPVPLITVAPPSKLMAINTTDTKRRNRNKKHRKRQTFTYNKTDHDDVPQDLRVRQRERSNEPLILVNSNERIKQTNIVSGNSHVCNNPPRFYQPTTLNIGNQTQLNCGLLKHPSDLPPVTVLVPYPIVVPFPVPIPIPIPLGGLLVKEKRKENDEKKDNTDAQKEIDLTLVEEDEVKSGVSRPLRKRKRLLDNKPRLLNKKKTLAV